MRPATIHSMSSESSISDSHFEGQSEESSDKGFDSDSDQEVFLDAFDLRVKQDLGRLQPMPQPSSKPLYSPHLVLDVPLWASQLSLLPSIDASQNRESQVIRWTAVDCGAEEFLRERYVLRGRLFCRPRATRLLVSLRIGERDGEEMVRRSIERVLRCVGMVDGAKDLRPRVEWREVVVLLVGSSENMLPETVALLEGLNLHIPIDQDPPLEDRGETGQICEYTTLLNPCAANERPTESPVPCQLIFFDSKAPLTADEANLWIVRAFAEALEAQFWVSVEPGKNLSDMAFYKVLCKFRNNPSFDCIVGRPSSVLSRSPSIDRTAFCLASGLSDEKLRKKPVKSSMKGVGDGVRAYRLKLCLGDILNHRKRPPSMSEEDRELIARHRAELRAEVEDMSPRQRRKFIEAWGPDDAKEAYMLLTEEV